MPIIIPNNHDDRLYESLASSGAALIGEHEALTQDIRPARIGLLNLMPAAVMKASEVQWLRHISHTVLQVEPVLLKFDDDPRDETGRSRADVLQRYTPFEEAASTGLDGLIITGDNLELQGRDKLNPQLLPFEEIQYRDQLCEVIDWARNNVFSTIYSCLASHFSLGYLFDIQRHIGNKKVFGVFEHEVNREHASPFTKDLDDYICAPHSRWGGVSIELVREVGLAILAQNPDAGWLMLESNNNCGGKDLFIQGHPEYNRFDLHHEYLRDREFGQEEPVGYYRDNKPMLSWESDARALHSNWIGAIYRQFSNVVDLRQPTALSATNMV